MFTFGTASRAKELKIKLNQSNCPFSTKILDLIIKIYDGTRELTQFNTNKDEVAQRLLLDLNSLSRHLRDEKETVEYLDKIEKLLERWLKIYDDFTQNQNTLLTELQREFIKDNPQGSNGQSKL